MPLDRRQLKIVTDKETVDEEFASAVFYFTDDSYDEIRKSATKPVELARAEELLRDSRRHARRDTEDTNLEAELLRELYNPSARGSFRAFIKGKKHSDLRFLLNPNGAIPEVSPEEVALLNIDPGGDQSGIWYLTHTREEWNARKASSNESHRAMAPEHYQIVTTIAKNDHLAGVADIRIAAVRGGDRVIAFGLLPTLRVSRVTEAGVEVPFIQESHKRDGGFYVVLPAAMEQGSRHQLRIEYEGDKVISKEGNGNFSVGARTSWYPSLNEFADRATYDLTFKSPRQFTLVGVGKLIKESREGDFTVSQWKSDIPLAVAGFNYGKFIKKEGTVPPAKFGVEAYATTEPPSFLKEVQLTQSDRGPVDGGAPVALGTMSPSVMANTVLTDANNSIRVFEHWFGPNPYGRIAITQQPAFNFGQSWPTLVYLPVSSFLDSTTRWGLLQNSASDYAKFIQEVTPHEVAHQWWGHMVGWASYHDQWLSEGFADFSAALFLEATEKPERVQEFWKKAREALLEKNRYGRRANDAGPLWMGLRLSNARNPGAYGRVVYLKGAYVLHMLRLMMRDSKTGDQAFIAMMRDFVKTHLHQNPSTEDFQRAVEKHVTPAMNMLMNGKMDWFFLNWVYNTDIPRYALEYSLKDENGQTLLVGKLAQSDVSPGFAMRVPLYVEFEGRPVFAGSFPIVGNTTREVRVLLPKKPKRVLLNYRYDVLSADNAVKEVP
jgi:aminopeptidase N